MHRDYTNTAETGLLRWFLRETPTKGEFAREIYF